MNNLCTLVVCGAPLAGRATDVASGLVAASWRVKVVLTPSALAWVTEDDVRSAIGDPGRSRQRDPQTPKDRERPSVVIVAPMTFNTVGKVANGIADTLAHSTLCEALGEGLPILAVPMVNDRLWGHPAWRMNLDRLGSAGVRWINVHDGSVGPPQVVESGTGDDLVRKFEPAWITEAVSRLV